MEYCLIPISFSAACSPSRCNTRWGLRGFSRDIKEPSNDETWVESISHSTKRIKIGMFYINTGATHKERNNYYLFTTLIFHEWNWLFLLFMRKSIEKIHYLLIYSIPNFTTELRYFIFTFLCCSEKILLVTSYNLPRFTMVQYLPQKRPNQRLKTPFSIIIQYRRPFWLFSNVFLHKMHGFVTCVWLVTDRVLIYLKRDKLLVLLTFQPYVIVTATSSPHFCWTIL